MAGVRNVVLALALAAMAPMPSFAQSEGEAAVVQSPILTIDQERLFTGTLWGQRAEKRIEAASADLAAENRRIETELTSEEKALTEQRPTMKPEDFQKAAEAFDTKVTEIRREQDGKARAIGQMRDAERQRFLKEALPVMTGFLRERRAVAVLDARAIFLAAEAIDVTDEMVAAIDRTLGAGEDVQIPEESPDAAPSGSDAGAPPPESSN